MADNYFKVWVPGAHVHELVTFDNTSIDSARSAWTRVQDLLEAARRIGAGRPRLGAVSLFAKTRLQGPWDRLPVIGENRYEAPAGEFDVL